MVIPQGSLLLTILLGLSAVAHAQQPMDDVAVGQEICTAGYVMDESCITNVQLMDYPEFATLENPEEHSSHCLLDVPICYESPFHILTDPRPDNAPNTYGPGWAAADNALLITVGRQLGQCDTCTGILEKGMRLQVRGTVVTLDPPVIDVTSVDYLEEGAQGCPELTSDAGPTTSDADAGGATPDTGSGPVNNVTETGEGADPVAAGADTNTTETGDAAAPSDAPASSGVVVSLQSIFTASMVALVYDMM